MGRKKGGGATEGRERDGGSVKNGMNRCEHTAHAVNTIISLVPRPPQHHLAAIIQIDRRLLVSSSDRLPQRTLKRVPLISSHRTQVNEMQIARNGNE